MYSAPSIDSAPVDRSMIDRAAPPGSMRYFSLLYAPPEKREVLTALYVVAMEIAESARSISHDVAHTRLAWWRSEIDRLANATPQHPAARVLLPLRTVPGLQLSRFNDLMLAADADLACLTFSSSAELAAYTERSSGVLFEIAARWVAAPAELSADTAGTVVELGSLVREVEILRDVRQDAVDGRVYLPLATLDLHHVAVADLRKPDLGAGYRAALEEYSLSLRQRLAEALRKLPAAERHSVRPIFVMASLYLRLLDRIRRENFAVTTQRVDLDGIDKAWTAWRAALKAR
jgi:phytoene synthase